MKYLLCILSIVMAFASVADPNSDARIVMAIYFTGFVIADRIYKNRGRA